MNRERIATVSVNDGNLELQFGQESPEYTDSFQLVIAQNQITSHVLSDLPDGFHRMFATSQQTVSMTEYENDEGQVILKIKIRDSNGLQVVFDVTVDDENLFDDMDNFFARFQSRSLMDIMIEGY